MMNRLKEILKRKAEIRSLLESGEDVDLDALESELNDLNKEEDTIRRRQSMAQAINSGEVPAEPIPTPVVEQRDADTDPTRTVEYRRAFMRFAQTGEPIRGFDAIQQRADAFSGVADTVAIIPSTILDEIISQLKTYGQLFSRVRKLGIKGGVSVPILTLKPVATWINDTTTPVSDRQKVELKNSVTFSYHGLECRVAVSLIAEAVTLDSFESTIRDLIVEAMVKALDTAIIKGTGTGQPLGITVDPRVTNEAELNSVEVGTWQGWKKNVFAQIPLSYRAGGTFIMAAGTFETYIDGMVDDAGQPVGRVNHGITEGAQERFSGREVLLVEDDIIAPYDAADEGDIVAVFCRLSDYAINSNMNMAMYRWFDHDTNQWVDKAVMIVDGKVLDPHGIILIKKGEEVVEA